MKKIVMCLVLGLFTMAGAASKLDARALLVNPVTTDIQASVWVDRDDTGNGKPSYAPGDVMVIYAKPNQDTYLYLFNIDAQGRIDLIVPNGYADGTSFTKAGTVRRFPSAQANFKLNVADVLGLSRIFLVASKTELSLAQIATLQQGDFAKMALTGTEGLQRGLQVSLQTVNAWSTDSAFYNVATKVSPPATFGTLRISSTPKNATVIIDGKNLGKTPLQVNRINSGKHTLTLHLVGYRDIVQSIIIEPNKTLTLNLTQKK